MILRIKKTYDLEGRLGAVLVRTLKNGSERMEHYDTRGQTEEPDGTILVFNTETGQYTPADNLAHARELMMEHKAKWLHVTYEPEVERVYALDSSDIEHSNERTEVVKI